MSVNPYNLRTSRQQNNLLGKEVWYAIFFVIGVQFLDIEW